MSKYEGWHTEEGAYADGEDDIITIGQSFLINNDNGTYAVQFCGEVAQSEKVLPCDQGYTMIGNYAATAQPVNAFRIASGDDGDVEGDGSETMQFLNSQGNQLKTYTWYAKGEMSKYEGWHTEEGAYAEDPEEDVIQPGIGFMYNNDNGTSVMTIPGVTIVTEK